MMGNACIGIGFASGVVNNKLRLLFFKEENCVLPFTFGCFAFRKEQGLFECVCIVSVERLKKRQIQSQFQGVCVCVCSFC